MIIYYQILDNNYDSLLNLLAVIVILLTVPHSEDFIVLLKKQMKRFLHFVGKANFISNQSRRVARLVEDSTRPHGQLAQACLGLPPGPAHHRAPAAVSPQVETEMLP